ncbi:sensor histidine kinase [Aurantiacibacter gilvus]|uniref:Histidine kinase/HSP90-like ATPase domain-containing protein n=1 Tax=Aurantiacibacter gilvus TaxID=3139141 RepID=A0ABU9IFT6_9SPHN
MQTARQRDWRQLALAIVVLQAAYWLFLGPLFEPVQRPLDRIQPTAIEVAEIDAPTWEAASSASYHAVDVPWEECCEEGYRAVRVTFALDEIPPTGIGEVPIIGADNYTAWINGSQHYAEGRMELPDISYHGRAYRGINRLPAGLLNLGENQLTYVLVSEEGTGGFFAASPYLGEYDAVIAQFGFRNFLLNEYLLICSVIGALVALLAFVGWARGGFQRYLFWLGTLSGSWAFLIFQSDWADPWFTGRLFALVSSCAMMLIPVAWVNMTNNWAGHRLPYVLPASLVIYAAGVVIFNLANAGDAGTNLAAMFSYIVSGVLALAVLGLLAWKVRHIGREHTWEFAVFVLCATVLAGEALGEIFDLNIGSPTDYILPFLLVALAAAFFARNIRLFRSSEEINTLLQGQLDERTAELATAHQREKVLLREQAHQDERRRIMADMHDGLGSQLMSLLLLARRGKADPERVTRGLQGALDEMRLMIDSMDSVGESLASALALFRERAAERATGAGFAIEWNDTAEGYLPNLSPRAVLQVFRVLQEALTNALKHSDGTVVTVNVASHAISVCDNGTLLGDERPGGRGLENMTARASAIGGSFTLRREGEQTVARIELPQEQGGPEGRNRATSHG